MVESWRYNKIPGFLPVLGSPLGCFIIYLSRRFVALRLSDAQSRGHEDIDNFVFVVSLRLRFSRSPGRGSGRSGGFISLGVDIMSSVVRG